MFLWTDSDANNASKREYITKLAGQIVDEYVLNTARYEELAKEIAEWNAVGNQKANEASKDSSVCDDILSYQKALMEYGLLLYNFKDAINEGDGERNIPCWKLFLLYLRNDKRRAKYALEALYLMFQVLALLRPKAAHELIWNRSVKLRKLTGSQVIQDLIQNYKLTMLSKDAIDYTVYTSLPSLVNTMLWI